MAFDEKAFSEDLKNPEVLGKVFEAVKGTEVMTNYTQTLQKAYFEQNKGTEHGYAFGLVDKALEEAGLKKPDNMKTSEYAAQIAKEKLQLQKDLDILKAEKSGTNVDEKVKAIEAKYKKDLEDTTTSYTSKLSELEKQLNQERTANQVQQNMSKLSVEFGKLTFNPAIPKSGIDAIAQVQLDILAKNADKDANGNPIWKDAQGNVIKNSNLLAASTEEVLKSVFKDFIQVGTPGGNAQGTGAPSSMNGDILILSNNNFTTQAEFAVQYKKDLASQGIPNTGDRARIIFLATKAHYNIDKLKES